MAKPSMKKIVEARQMALQGVDYSPKLGAVCPWCGSRAIITNTQPWFDNTRVRYHRCGDNICVLSRMGISIKSIEVDYSGK